MGIPDSETTEPSKSQDESGSISEQDEQAAAADGGGLPEESASQGDDDHQEATASSAEAAEAVPVEVVDPVVALQAELDR